MTEVHTDSWIYDNILLIEDVVIYYHGIAIYYNNLSKTKMYGLGTQEVADSYHTLIKSLIQKY